MQYGLLMMPMHLPEKSLAQAFDEDIDLLIARVVPRIQHMWLRTGVVLLQFHHPVLSRQSSCLPRPFDQRASVLRRWFGRVTD